jgi:cation diffusion facilitator CzcD-associated flavoprotein CzcO
LPWHADNFVIGDADLDTDGADETVKTNPERKPWRTPLVIVATPMDETADTPPIGGADTFGSHS